MQQLVPVPVHVWNFNLFIKQKKKNGVNKKELGRSDLNGEVLEACPVPEPGEGGVDEGEE